MNDKRDPNRITRRDFLQQAGVGAAGTLIMMSETRLFAQPTSGEEASLLKDITSQPQGDLDRFLASQEPYSGNSLKRSSLIQRRHTSLLDKRAPSPSLSSGGSRKDLTKLRKTLFPSILNPPRRPVGKLHEATVRLLTRSPYPAMPLMRSV